MKASEEMFAPHPVCMTNSHQQVALQGTFLPQPQSRPRKYWRVWSTVSVSIQTDEDAI